jgi:hypothetical protein
LALAASLTRGRGSVCVGSNARGGQTPLSSVYLSRSSVGAAQSRGAHTLFDYGMLVQLAGCA